MFTLDRDVLVLLSDPCGFCHVTWLALFALLTPEGGRGEGEVGGDPSADPVGAALGGEQLAPKEEQEEIKEQEVAEEDQEDEGSRF